MSPKPKNAKRISVLIADSQLLLSDSLAAGLRADDALQVFDERPTSAVEAVKAASSLRPDVALVDLWLEGMETSAVARAILKRSGRTKILHLSWFHGPTQVEESLAFGAVGFLPKNITLAKVNEAIHRAHAEERPVFAAELEAMVRDIGERNRLSDATAGAMSALTPRELEILVLMARGYTLERMLEALGIKRQTARQHIHRILRKIGARTQIEAVAMARDQGLLG